MRKITLSLLAISFFMLTLCSCSIITPSPPVTEFTANAIVKTAGETYSVLIESEQGCVKISINEPEKLKGLIYTYTKDTLYIEYEKLRCNATTDYLRKEAFADVIYRALIFDETKPLEIKERSNEYTKYIVKNSSSEIELLCDTKSGVIKKITPSYTDVVIEFSD